MPRANRDGLSVDGFVDLELIGGGSFARVYRAADEVTGQPVALKVLDVQRSRTLNREVFDLEARALGKLSSHPNIVTLYRAFISRRGEPVLVMELCDASLATAISQRGAAAPSDALGIIIKLAGALATAHNAGIVHRDVKPQNIFITRYGEPALGDFGVAQLRDAATAGSPASAMTLYHAAPEVVLGDTVDERSDLYSLASTLYELLAGRPPFFVTEGEDPIVVQRRVLTEPTPPIRSNAIPLALQDILTSALAKDPSKRPADVVDFARLLRGVEDSEGWAATDCRIEGSGPLPPLLVRREVIPPSDLASRATSLPSLGLRTGSFADVEVTDRGLEPVRSEKAAEVVSKRPSVPIARHASGDRPTAGLPGFADPGSGETGRPEAEQSDPVTHLLLPPVPPVSPTIDTGPRAEPFGLHDQRSEDHPERVTSPPILAAPSGAAPTEPHEPTDSPSGQPATESMGWGYASAQPATSTSREAPASKTVLRSDANVAAEPEPEGDGSSRGWFRRGRKKP